MGDSGADLGESSSHSSLSQWAAVLGGEGKAGVGMGRRVGTASPKTSWENRQDGEPGSRSPIQHLPGPAPATLGQEIQAVPRSLSEGGGSLSGLSDCLGRAGESIQGGRRVGCQFLEGSLMKTPDGDQLGKGSPFPCVADKEQEIPQVR